MAEDPPQTRISRIQDIVGVFVLSITAVLTAWCGFESSKWGGEMSIAFSEASGARIQAASAENEARAAQQFDLSVYAQWVLAEGDGDAELAQYIQDRFQPWFTVGLRRVAGRRDGRERSLHPRRVRAAGRGGGDGAQRARPTRSSPRPSRATSAATTTRC